MPTSKDLPPEDADSSEEEDLNEMNEIVKKAPVPSEELVEMRNVRTLLLQRCAGLDRGLAARVEDVRSIESTARALEEYACAQPISWANEEDVNMLNGRWRLVYTSAFAEGGSDGMSSPSLGGARPGPPSNGPVRLGKVYQRIQTRKRRLDNIIEPVYLDAPWPLPFPSFLPSPAATVQLGHELELVDNDRIRITGDGATIRPRGGPSFIRPLTFETPKLPFVDQLRNLLPEEVRQAFQRIGSSTFRVAYLDKDVYVTRGDRGELRVFCRD